MDIRKLQRAIVDGLEDVKAQNIVVFNTEHLSPLFERVIIASGTSNRQTKALASSVRVAVKEAGLPVLSTEGSDNGEWIIVDCGPAVAHIMQPSIRDYYRLEEIWGGKPVKMKIGGDEPKGLVKASSDGDDEPVRKPAARKTASAKPAAKPAGKVAAKTAAGSATGRAASGKAAPGKPASGKAVSGKATSSKAASGKAAAPIVTSMSGTVGKAAPSTRSTTAARKSAIPSKQAAAAVKKVVVTAKKTAPSRSKAASAKVSAKAPSRSKAAPAKAAPARKTAARKSPVRG